MPKKKQIQSAGHAAHTKNATDSALPGSFPRPIKITMLGAGSAFTPRLLNDVLRTPGESGGTIALVDIDADRLTTMAKVARKLLRQLGKNNWRLLASTKRREVMAGSDYLVSCIEVSGTECVRFDNDIPAKYGVEQCIGDTLGPGGLFKALRTIPVFLEVLRDAERLCPDAMVLNYTNPMGMLCTAAARASSMRLVGLCHSVQGTSQLLADYSGVPYPELEWECAGINHLAWFTRLRHQGRDVYPQLKKQFATDLALAAKQLRDGTAWPAPGRRPDPGKPDTTGIMRDLVRKDMCVHFGAFITESSGHLSEYLPYYRKSEAGRAYLRWGYSGESGYYAGHWPQWRKNADSSRMRMLRGTEPMDWERSWEYASWIIEAREKNVPFRIHGNVMNAKGNSTLIDNLPHDGCVEVACLVDRNGIQPTRHGSLPPQMAALCRSNMDMISLAATAAVERSKETAIHALLLDPLCAAVCTPAQIRSMTLELFRAERDYLPGYR